MANAMHTNARKSSFMAHDREGIIDHEKAAKVYSLLLPSEKKIQTINVYLLFRHILLILIPYFLDC